MPDHPVAPNPFSAPQAPLNSPASNLPNAPTSLVGFVRTGQIIAAALAMGLTSIAGIFVFLTLSRGQPRLDPDPVYLWIGGVAFAMSVMSAGMVSAILRGKARDQLRSSAAGTDAQAGDFNTPQSSPSGLLNWEQQASLPPALRKFAVDQQTAGLISQAAIEGAGVINSILFLISGNWLLLAFAGMAILGILLQMPTINKLHSRIRSTLDLYPS